MQRYRVRENLDGFEDDEKEEDQYEDDEKEEDQYEDDEKEDQFEDEEDEEEECREQPKSEGEIREQPKSEEEIRYLQLREKRKAKLRPKFSKENGKINANIDRRKLFGFFGPSSPSIAKRVIQEHTSLLETKHLTPKLFTSQIDVKKVGMSSTTESENEPSNKVLPRQVKSKAQIIKQSRDYSWLMSEDTVIPKPAKDSGPAKSLQSKPDLRNDKSAQAQAQAQAQAKRFESLSPFATKRKAHASSVDPRRDVQRSSENKMVRKENVTASKLQIVKQPNRPSLQSNLENGHHIKKQKPATQLQRMSAAFNKDHKIKKRKFPVSDDEHDVSFIIRSMYRYDPTRFPDVDDDDDCMVANFEDIGREERRSAKIAKKEDAEELIKIQEEERVEREALLRRKAKKA